jgi:hypothetical protein
MTPAGTLFTGVETDLPSPRLSLKLRVDPNPFNPLLNIRFRSPVPGTADVDVFNAIGRMVRRIPLGRIEAGERLTKWDGRDSAGRQVASGRYFIRLTVGGLHATSATVLLK